MITIDQNYQRHSKTQRRPSIVTKGTISKNCPTSAVVSGLYAGKSTTTISDAEEARGNRKNCSLVLGIGTIMIESQRGFTDPKGHSNVLRIKNFPNSHVKTRFCNQQRPSFPLIRPCKEIPMGRQEEFHTDRQTASHEHAYMSTQVLHGLPPESYHSLYATLALCSGSEDRRRLRDF